MSPCKSPLATNRHFLFPLIFVVKMNIELMTILLSTTSTEIGLESQVSILSNVSISLWYASLNYSFST